MSRTLILLFGVSTYAIFLATFLYLVGFVMGFVTPTALPAMTAEGPFWSALAVNVGMVLLFGVQHCVMARSWFKRWWTRIVPAPIERSIFMLATCGILALMFAFWRPMGGELWRVEGELAWVIHGVGAVGWAIVLLSTFLIDHFDLFGLRQVWLAFRGRDYLQKPFVERSLYRVVRHPLMLGFLIAFWAAPVMTVSHLVMAASFTSFILLALFVEERELVLLHGDDYRDYQQRVPKLLPRVTKPAEPVVAR